MCGSAFERIHDLVEVPFGVGLLNRIPEAFLAEDDFAVDNGGGFAIARAEIKANAIDVGVATESAGATAFRRQSRGEDHFEGLFINSLTHDVGVEFARGGCNEMILKPLAQIGRADEMNSKASARPEEKFHEALNVCEIRGSIFV